MSHKVHSCVPVWAVCAAGSTGFCGTKLCFGWGSGFFSSLGGLLIQLSGWKKLTWPELSSSGAARQQSSFHQPHSLFPGHQSPATAARIYPWTRGFGKSRLSAPCARQRKPWVLGSGILTRDSPAWKVKTCAVGVVNKHGGKAHHAVA